jgi:hypothetical protein
MKHFITLLSFLIPAIFFGCSSVSTSFDYDPAVDFSKYKSFKIYEGETIPDDELEKNPLVKKRILNSVINELKSKGYEVVDSNEADMLIVIHAGIKERTEITDWGSYGWYNPWWGAYGGRIDVNQYEEGTLVIDMVDAEEDELVWRGLGTKILEDYSTQEIMQQRIDTYVAKILANFPPQKK